MTAHEYLCRVRDFDATLTNLRDEIDSLYERASGISSPALTADRVQTSSSLESPQERILPKIDKDIRRYEAEYNRYLRLRKRIVDQINRMPDWRHVRILYLTYIKGWHSYEIADEMNYVPEHVRRLRKQALDEFESRYLLQNVTGDM